MNSIQSASSQLQNIAKIINEINQKTNVINDIVLLEDSKGEVSNILQLTESRVQEGQSVCREAKTSFEDMFQSIRKIVKQTTDAMESAGLTLVKGEGLKN